ncbi:hypothetical protein PoB_005572600 [Plakobranchus ocellatus]|uniref:Uncharacterized protein n=1 Tax=Plakobranchus ocellatus TaxID=259542 RepID=A0AAV4CD00_9GAST|nr:hypothetical protein PoB_005572600 [Plakobranchus ocellatus]
MCSTMFILLTAGLLATVVTAQSDCTQRVNTCAENYSGEITSSYQIEDFRNCLYPIDCSNDPNGQSVKQSLLDYLDNLPMPESYGSDSGSMFSLSLVVCLICLMISLRR